MLLAFVLVSFPSPILFGSGISNPRLLLKLKDGGCELLSSPELALNGADDPGWKAVVNALSEGGRTISLNKLDICGSMDDSSLPREDTPRPVPSPNELIKIKGLKITCR